MRLTQILLLETVALVATLDGTSAASGLTLSKSNAANSVNLASDHRRYLRKYYDEADEADDEEERGWLDSLKSANVLAKLSTAKMSNDVFKAISDVRDSGTLIALFNQFKPQLKQKFPDFHDDMDANVFLKMVQKSDLPEDTQLALFSAFTKYRAAVAE